VASRCGFTNQYDDLQNLWSNYRNKGLVVIGIPTNDFKQEPATNADIKDFCENNFNISFPMTEKTKVIGEKAHPFYKWAKNNFGKGAIPKWNFHKIIIDKNGKVVDTFASITNPSSKRFVSFIENQIKN
jgi:glutathione peroxidase